MSSKQLDQSFILADSLRNLRQIDQKENWVNKFLLFLFSV